MGKSVEPGPGRLGDLAVVLGSYTCPSDRPQHRLSGCLVTGGIAQAFVQRHHDVTAQGELDIHDRLRSEQMRVAIQMRSE